ncbi:MAG TPA: hypothetical protein VHN14_20400 [Kofleriaceae bacterium]|jgi:hypothetical protein|nr:hypothetical protein [Kofleriaceae bacterium]
MIVIYGTRFYGQVDSYGGQRQLTKFFHIYYVPLIPVETLWVTRELDQGYSGHAVQMSGKSVLAGYARVWGPVAAIGAIAAGSVGGIIAAGALAALSAWTWTWRSLRNPREQRRSDFHLLAFGTRCDPLKMEHELASVLQAHVAERWAKVADGNTPEDIARIGAANPAQAVLAYASLRLAARLAPGDDARKAHDASERILDAIKDANPALEGGPYRSAAQPQLPADVSVTDGAGR